MLISGKPEISAPLPTGLQCGRFRPPYIASCYTRRAMSSPPAIAVDHLVKTYKKTTAVAGISFALAPGSITALLGGNGAGKTTTIAMIMGLVEPTSGSVAVLGA